MSKQFSILRRFRHRPKRPTDREQGRKNWEGVKGWWGRLIGRDKREEPVPPAKEIVEPPPPVAKKPSPVAKKPSPDKSKTTTGQRNKNPLNLKWSGSVWKGLAPDRKDSRNHLIFTDPTYGWRAGIINLRSYWTKHNLKTIHQIMSRWAPVTDTIGSLPGAAPNDPSAYSRFVAERVGVGPHDRLSIFDSKGKIKNAEQLKRLVSAMAVYENGHHYVVVDEELDGGIALV